jgi:dGTPase
MPGSGRSTTWPSSGHRRLRGERPDVPGLTKLAVKNETFRGLDLTRAVRKAVLKYPWAYGEGPTPELQERHRQKWCVYRSEHVDFEDARSIHVLPPAASGEPSQCVEATLMEPADDISYALHDFEDFYRTGLISLPALKGAAVGERPPKQAILAEVQRWLRDHFDFGAAEDAWRSVMAYLDYDLLAALHDEYTGSREQDAALVRLTSTQISRFIDGVGLDPSPAHPVVVVDPLIEHEIAIWKQMTWQFVINRPGFGIVQAGQARVVEATARELATWVGRAGTTSIRLPRRLRDYIALGFMDKDDPDFPEADEVRVRSRAILDYVASLTEPQLLMLHDQLTGAWRSSMISGAVV